MAIDLHARLNTPELVAFRKEVRAFMTASLPSDIRAKVAAERMDLPKEDQRRWHRILRQKGWACPNWAREYGGPGFSLEQQYIFESELGMADAPRPMVYGTGMLGPTLMHHGSAAQKARFLPRILEADDFWCQGFSEPGSGSDLASLKCRAVRDGDRYIINGSKIWTSEAHIADWMFGIFRTDSSGRKQQGITFLMLDLSSPGVEVRPIETYDGSGTEINQVFFDDVLVPVDQRVGEEGHGWGVAKDLLTFERFGTAEVSRSRSSIRRLREAMEAPDEVGRRLIDEPDLEARLVDLEIELAAIENTETKILLAGPPDAEPGAEAALLKLRGTEVQNDIFTLAMDVLGIEALTEPPSDGAPGDRPSVHDAARTYFNYRKTMIYAGSNEVQKNIIAKAVLGL